MTNKILKVFSSFGLTSILFFLTIILTSCGGPDSYKLKAKIMDGKDATFRIITHTPSGPEMNLLASRQGIFELRDTLTEPVMVEVFTNDYNRIGVYWAVPDDELEIEINPEGLFGFGAKGSEVNERLSGWIKKNKDLIKAGPSEALNETVKKYVVSNPKDIVSTMLFATLWDSKLNPEETISLWNKINPSVRPEYIRPDIITLARAAVLPASTGVLPDMSFRNQDDTLEYYQPDTHKVSIIAFSNENFKVEHDSITRRFDELKKKYPKEKEVKIIDYSLDSDVRSWRSSTFVDTAEYTRAWSGPGRGAIGVAELALGRLPFFIVADSTGNQVYRGSSLDEATDQLKKLIDK